MLNSSLVRAFFTPDHKLFVILDAAVVPALLAKLHHDEPEHVCLFRGELLQNMAEVAPYLVHLERDSRFTQWLLSQGWGKHWGIFAHIKPEIDLKQVRKHFRTLLRAELPNRRAQQFRFYDPYILKDFLTLCNEAETQTVFGRFVSAYFVEGDTADRAIRFTVNKKGLPYDETLRLD